MEGTNDGGCCSCRYYIERVALFYKVTIAPKKIDSTLRLLISVLLLLLYSILRLMDLHFQTCYGYRWKPKKPNWTRDNFTIRNIKKLKKKKN